MIMITSLYDEVASPAAAAANAKIDWLRFLRPAKKSEEEDAEE